ncbi:signal peptidase II [Jatrophihabitans sp. GAS493]|nr:signal peptidase II [Jatrophihabitans sp. GAS493]
MTATTPVQAAPARPRRLGVFAAVAVAALLADVLSKALVVAKLKNHAPVRTLDGVVYLVYTRNSGAAFSVGAGATLLFTLVAAGIVAVIIRFAAKLRSVAWAISLGLILGGALGNLGDRIFRAPSVGRGHVVDWISVFADDGHVWPIFNIADSAVVCGAVLAAILAIRGIELDGARPRRSRS